MILCLCLYQSFVEEQHFFEAYEMSFQSLKQSAEALVTADSTGLHSRPSLCSLWNIRGRCYCNLGCIVIS